MFTIMVFTTTTAAICGHATLGKPKRFRQTVLSRFYVDRMTVSNNVEMGMY